MAVAATTTHPRGPIPASAQTARAPAGAEFFSLRGSAAVDSLIDCLPARIAIRHHHPTPVARDRSRMSHWW